MEFSLSHTHTHSHTHIALYIECLYHRDFRAQKMTMGNDGNLSPDRNGGGGGDGGDGGGHVCACHTA